MSTGVIALILTGLSLIGALFSASCVFLYKATRKLTTMDEKLDRAVYWSSFVPGLWSDVETIKKHLDISTPHLPVFNGQHDAEE